MRAALIATILAASTLASPSASAETPRAAPSESHLAAADSRAQADEPRAKTDDAHAPAHDPPLIAYALELGQARPHFDTRSLHKTTTALRTINFEMAAHPPPRDEDCAQTLGASRFADQYERLANLQEQLGDFEAVLQANKSALACRPRSALYAALTAYAYLVLDRLDEARAAVEHGHVLDPDDSTVRDIHARVDFAQERWADAKARYQLVLANPDLSSEGFEYARCYLWLAQRRAGVRNPEVPQARPPLEHGDEPRHTDWPTPILETLRGERSEAELAQLIRETERGDRTEREQLTEALFYIGELRLAEGDTETARRHFASVVNLRALNFVEYGLARVELQKMRNRASVAGTATPGTASPGAR